MNIVKNRPFLFCALLCNVMTHAGGLYSLFYLSLCWCLWLHVTKSVDMTKNVVDKRSPYYQHLPDCTDSQNKSFIFKKTTWKGIVCPMIKDEVGFLSEWVAFYEMQGFNKVVFYDNQSNTTFEEIEPWIKSGFVDVVHNWWPSNSKLLQNPTRKFRDMMYIKYLGESHCKGRAIKEGYDVFVSLDLDEYLFPRLDSWTMMDELHDWFNSTTRGVMVIPKLQFNPVPHFLEPINLLTIEAYTMRMEGANKMNYYNSVSPKVALRLNWEGEYSKATLDFITYCCDFHGCGSSIPKCRGPLKDERWKLEGKHKPWKHVSHIHHYARSLEKYAMKQRTWTTAGTHRNYDVLNFLDRSFGFTYDDTALAWSCQLREVLRNRTGEAHYLRPGNEWARNPEFGRTVEDPLKRGRYGSGYGVKLAVRDMNPYPPGDTYQRAHKVFEEAP